MSDECFSYNNTNFHHFGSALVITARRTGINRFRTNLRKKSDRNRTRYYSGVRTKNLDLHGKKSHKRYGSKSYD